jgi:hypothetical protein
METKHFAGIVRTGPTRGKVILTIPKTIESYHTAEEKLRMSGTMGSQGLTEADMELSATMGSMDLSSNIRDMHTWTMHAKDGAHAVMPFVEPKVMATLRSTVENPVARFGDDVQPNEHHICGKMNAITASGREHPSTMTTFNEVGVPTGGTLRPRPVAGQQCARSADLTWGGNRALPWGWVGIMAPRSWIAPFPSTQGGTVSISSYT